MLRPLGIPLSIALLAGCASQGPSRRATPASACPEGQQRLGIVTNRTGIQLDAYTTNRPAETFVGQVAANSTQEFPVSGTSRLMLYYMQGGTRLVPDRSRIDIRYTCR